MLLLYQRNAKYVTYADVEQNQYTTIDRINLNLVLPRNSLRIPLIKWDMKFKILIYIQQNKMKIDLLGKCIDLKSKIFYRSQFFVYEF